MKAQKQERKEVIKTATKYKWVKKYPQYMYSGSIVKAEEKLMRVLHTKYGYKKSHSRRGLSLQIINFTFKITIITLQVLRLSNYRA